MQPARVLAADPAWLFGDHLPGNGRGAAKNYPCMRLEDIERFPLPPLERDAWLFLWYVTSMVDEARAVVRAWDFRPTGGELTWVKTGSEGALVVDPLANASTRARGLQQLHYERVPVASLAFGMGRTVRNCTEHCIIARRGRPQRASASVRDVFFAPVGEHSEKPDRFYQLVEELTGDGPRVELFARRERPGWIAYGNQVARAAPARVR